MLTLDRKAVFFLTKKSWC